MNIQAIFNLIVYYFLEIKLSHLNVINCWSIEERMQFINFTSSELLFVRSIRLPITDFESIFGDICQYGSGTREGFVVDYTCPNVYQVLEQLSLRRCFTMTRYWLFYETWNNYLIEDFRHVNLSVDAHISYAKLVSSSPDRPIVFDLYDVYNNGRELGGRLNVTFDRTLNCSLKDEWSVGPLCQVIHHSNFSSLTFFQNRATLADITMTIGTVIVKLDINQPDSVLFEYLNTMNNIHLDNFSRYCYRLSILVNEMLKYNVTWIHYNKWTENYTSGGALRGIETGEVIQVAAPFIMDAPRLKNVWTILHSASFRTIFLFRTPQNAATGERFTKPFQSYVWICILVMLFVFSFGLKNIFALERNLNQAWTFLPSYISVLMSNFGELCQQSSLFMPKTSGGRMSHVLFLISCFLLYNYYTCLLVAFLLGTPAKSDIKTLTQLADSSLEIGIENITYHRTHFTFPRPDLVYFAQKKLKPLNDPAAIWVPPEMGICKARKAGYAFLCEESIAFELIGKYFKPNQICDLNEVDVQSKKPLGNFIKKGSPYNDILKIKFIWMYETGLISKHHRYWFRRKPQCISENTIESVSVEYAAPAFYVIAIGMGLSIFALFIEFGIDFTYRLFKRFRSRHHRD